MKLKVIEPLMDYQNSKLKLMFNAVILFSTWNKNELIK